MNEIINGVEYDISKSELRNDGLYEVYIIDAGTGKIVYTVIQGNPFACALAARNLIIANDGIVYLVP